MAEHSAPSIPEPSEEPEPTDPMNLAFKASGLPASSKSAFEAGWKAHSESGSSEVPEDLNR